MVIFYLLILCLCERTFQHSVYPVSPGLLRQPINYVTQVNCSFFFLFFFRKGLVYVVTLCFGPFFSLSLGLNCHGSPSARTHTHTSIRTHTHTHAHTHTQRESCAWRNPALFLKRCDLVFFGRALCNLVNAGALHVGNVSEPSTELRLARGAHSPLTSSPSRCLQT